MLETAIGRIIVGAVALAVMLLPSTADAKRVALVIGVGKYQHLSGLNNTIRDAEAVADLLSRHGFEVTTRTDPSYAELVVALDEFESAATGADVALFFYAGHGMHLFGKDILAPKDMTQRCLIDTSQESVRTALKGTVELNKVMRALQNARRKVVLIDACRNQPFPSCPKRGEGRDDLGNGGGFRTLGRLEARGILIASSALPGSLALDGAAGTHSPFATALLRRLEERPKAYIRDVLEAVAEDVVAATGGEQEPHIQSLGRATRTCLDVDGCGTKSPAAVEIERLRNQVAKLKAQQEQQRDEIESKPAEPPPPQIAALPKPAVTHQSRPRSARERCDSAGGGVTICGSSMLGSQYGNDYLPRNLIDGDLTTAWVEGARGDGRGEWVVFEFAGARTVEEVVIRNGYSKSNDIFSKNGRVREAELVFSGGQRVRIELRDERGAQRFRLSPAIEAEWMQLRVDSVYPGWKYKDLAISEIDVVAR